MNDPSSSSARAYLALIFGLFTIAFSAILVQLADAPGTISAFYRMAIGALITAPLFLFQLRAQRSRLTKQALSVAVLGGLFFALDLSFWATGIVISGATTPTLMANTAPLWVGLGALWLFGEQLNRSFWLGLIVAMVGAAFVLGADFSQAVQEGLGTLLGLLAALFYGAYYLVTQRGRALLNSLTYFWITVVTSALTLGFINIALNRSFFGYDGRTYLSFLALGAGVQTLGWLAINYSQGFLPAAIVAPTLLGQPLFTAVLAVLLLGERFSAGHLVGGGAVLLGIYVVHWSRHKEAPTVHIREKQAIANQDQTISRKPGGRGVNRL